MFTAGYTVHTENMRPVEHGWLGLPVRKVDKIESRGQVSTLIPMAGGVYDFRRGLLDRSTARYFYKGSKTSLHKHTGNLVENLFYKKNVHLKVIYNF
jgi:hypothetical protein